MIQESVLVIEARSTALGPPPGGGLGSLVLVLLLFFLVSLLLLGLVVGLRLVSLLSLGRLLGILLLFVGGFILFAAGEEVGDGRDDQRDDQRDAHDECVEGWGVIGILEENRKVAELVARGAGEDGADAGDRVDDHTFEPARR